MKANIQLLLIMVLMMVSCKQEAEETCISKSFQVIATAYNSLAYQTNSNPNITAFNPDTGILLYLGIYWTLG